MWIVTDKKACTSYFPLSTFYMYIDYGLLFLISVLKPEKLVRVRGLKIEVNGYKLKKSPQNLDKMSTQSTQPNTEYSPTLKNWISS